jgi:hypothetical protein
VCFIIIKARALVAKDVRRRERQAGSNPTDDRQIGVLEQSGEDAVDQEIRSLIANLSVDEQIDLLALGWLGREDRSAEEWPSVRELATDQHDQHIEQYLIGDPLLPDNLEAGLAILGRDCAEYQGKML